MWKLRRHRVRDLIRRDMACIAFNANTVLTEEGL